MTVWKLCVLLVCVAAACAPPRHVLRATFEQEGAPKGWAFRRSRGECFGAVDDTEPRGGHSLRLHIPKDTTARAHWAYRHKVALEPSTGYRLSVRMMGADVAGPQGEAYFIFYENGVEGPTHWHVSERVRGTADWRAYAVEFVTRPDTTWGRLVLKLRHGTGAAWFDDVTLEEADVEAIEAKKLAPPPDDGFAIQAMWTPAQWCREDGQMRLLRGFVNPCALFFWGKKDAVKDPAIIITAEEGLVIRGPLVCGRRPAPAEVKVTPQPCRRGGRRCLRWRFPISPDTLAWRMRPDRPHWENYHFLYVEPTERCPRKFRLDWQLETGGALGPLHSLEGSVAEMPAQRLAPQPLFKIHVQHTGGLRHPHPAVRKRLLDYLMSAGMTGGLSLTYWVPEDAPADAQFRREGWDLHTWLFYAYGAMGQKSHPLIKHDGTVFKGKMCPTALLRKTQPFYGKLVQYFRGKLATGLKAAIIDYEPPVHSVCFCPTCRAEFARHASLPADTLAAMAPKDIYAQHDPAWGKFRAWQNGQVVKMLADAIHEVDPEVQVGLCASNRHPHTVSRGMDIALFEPAAAFHTPMIYTKGVRFHDLVDVTCEGTRAPVRPFIELSDISQPRHLTPHELRMNLLATALSGGRGAYMWVGLECFDADYILAIRQAYLDVGRFIRHTADATRSDGIRVEPVFDSERFVEVAGRRVRMTLPEQRPFVRSHVWKCREGYLVGALNYHSKRSFRIRLRAAAPGRWTVERLLPQGRRKAADLNKGFVLKLQPQGAAVVLVRRAK